MSKKEKISKEERQTFRESMKDTHPLPPNAKKTLITKPRSDNKNQHATSPAAKTYEQIITESFRGEENINYHKTGTNAHALKKLKRGQLRPEAKLDLHGETLASAATIVANYIEDACQHGCKVVLIIHGKGQSSGQRYPVLKNAVAGWLKNDLRVLAYYSAQAQDGGQGATYVLLKSQR